jgi:hypothetical protein
MFITSELMFITSELQNQNKIHKRKSLEIPIGKSKMERQRNGQKKRDKRTNNDL